MLDDGNVRYVEGLIEDIPNIEDLRLIHKELVQLARLAYDELSEIEKEKVLNINKLFEAEWMIEELEIESTKSPYIYLLSPELLEVYDNSSVLFEGYITNFKYLDKVLIGNVEVDFEYLEYVELRHPDNPSTIIHRGPAIKFSEIIEMVDKYHAISVQAISKSGAKGNIARRFYVDTTAPTLDIIVEDRGVDSDKATITAIMNDNFGYLSLYLFDSHIYIYDAWVRGDFANPKERTYTQTVDLDIGDNEFVFTLFDGAGNKTVKKVNITREEPKPVEKGDVQISLYKDSTSSTNKIDFTNISNFYIKNKETGKTYSEGTTPWNGKERFVMKGIPVGDYTIHFDMQEGMFTKEIQIGEAYKETIYNKESNPLTVNVGKTSYAKIVLNTNLILQEILPLDDLIVPIDITLDEFMEALPKETTIIDSLNHEHQVALSWDIRPYNFDNYKKSGEITLWSNFFKLPISVSNTVPSTRLEVKLKVIFE